MEFCVCAFLSRRRDSPVIACMQFSMSAQAGHQPSVISSFLERSSHRFLEINAQANAHADMPRVYARRTCRRALCRLSGYVSDSSIQNTTWKTIRTILRPLCSPPHMDRTSQALGTMLGRDLRARLMSSLGRMCIHSSMPKTKPVELLCRTRRTMCIHSSMYHV